MHPPLPPIGLSMCGLCNVLVLNQLRSVHLFERRKHSFHFHFHYHFHCVSLPVAVATRPSY
jgi:hypothetical protein